MHWIPQMRKEKMDEISDVLQKLARSREASEAQRRKLDVEEKNIRKNLSHEVQTRSYLTYYFLVGFFGLIVGCFFFVLWYNSAAVGWIQELHEKGLNDQANKIELLELSKVLSVIIGALGTSLGFIIGYYFKEKSE